MKFVGVHVFFQSWAQYLWGSLAANDLGKSGRPRKENQLDQTPSTRTSTHWLYVPIIGYSLPFPIHPGFNDAEFNCRAGANFVRTERPRRTPYPSG
jgi:hypothetical protein